MAKSLKAGSTTGVPAPLQPYRMPFETACRDVQALKGLLDQGKKQGKEDGAAGLPLGGCLAESCQLRRELQVVMPSFYMPACCACPTATRNGSLAKAQCAAWWADPDVQRSTADLPGNTSWSWAGSTKGLVLPGQLGSRWLAGCHMMLCIDEQDTSAFKRCKISWIRALLAAATFQGLNAS